MFGFSIAGKYSDGFPVFVSGDNESVVWVSDDSPTWVDFSVKFY